MRRRKKDAARIALLGILGKRVEQLLPQIKVTMPVSMLAELLPSLVRTMLGAKSVDMVEAHILLKGDSLVVSAKTVALGPRKEKQQ